MTRNSKLSCTAGRRATDLQKTIECRGRPLMRTQVHTPSESYYVPSPNTEDHSLSEASEALSEWAFVEHADCPSQEDVNPTQVNLVSPNAEQQPQFDYDEGSSPPPDTKDPHPASLSEDLGLRRISDCPSKKNIFGTSENPPGLNKRVAQGCHYKSVNEPRILDRTLSPTKRVKTGICCPTPPSDSEDPNPNSLLEAPHATRFSNRNLSIRCTLGRKKWRSPRKQIVMVDSQNKSNKGFERSSRITNALRDIKVEQTSADRRQPSKKERKRTSCQLENIETHDNALSQTESPHNLITPTSTDVLSALVQVTFAASRLRLVRRPSGRYTLTPVLTSTYCSDSEVEGVDITTEE